jgi:3-oxoacyl-[acyl-carrier protein] reductase
MKKTVLITGSAIGIGRAYAQAFGLGGYHVVVTDVLEKEGRALAQLSDEKWDQTFDIDLKGMLRVIRPALPLMKTRKTGAIICVSSLMGTHYGWDEHVHYSAAKAGDYIPTGRWRCKNWRACSTTGLTIVECARK